MKTLLFTDIITKETFRVTCNDGEIHHIERINEDLAKWCEGRIITRVEI